MLICCRTNHDRSITYHQNLIEALPSIRSGEGGEVNIKTSQNIVIPMTRLQSLFHHKTQKILNVYCTAGYPLLDSTLQVMQSLEANGADIIELGMPYSDPLADGPVIQNSGMIALHNGMTIATLFTQLKTLRLSPQNGGIGDTLPVILMGYMNPVLQYGFEKFCADAVAVGID